MKIEKKKFLGGARTQMKKPSYLIVGGRRASLSFLRLFLGAKPVTDNKLLISWYNDGRISDKSVAKTVWFSTPF